MEYPRGKFFLSQNFFERPKIFRIDLIRYGKYDIRNAGILEVFPEEAGNLCWILSENTAAVSHQNDSFQRFHLCNFCQELDSVIESSYIFLFGYSPSTYSGSTVGCGTSDDVASMNHPFFFEHYIRDIQGSVLLQRMLQHLSVF